MKILILIATMTLVQISYGQKKTVPVIKATSIKADIKEDSVLFRNLWTIVPELKPDVFLTSAQKVTFYTDIDSISFNIDRKVGTYDFIVLLNGKDTARTQIKYEPSRLEILQGAGKYNDSDTRFIPQFTYLSPDDPNLKRVREVLKLDSIAGNGHELSRIFNLLYWLHNLVRHDGNSDNPKSKNAIDLIEICRVENRGVNCRMLAMILNECYLSLGIKSRYVTCMPKESEFGDCHVINMVYSEVLDKWIWIDPTFGSYVMDEKGNLLGIQEVRERLVKKMPVILNANANWNRVILQTKEIHLYQYMAKNLYRLQCPLSSEYNTETRENGKEQVYVELLPLDGIEQTPQKQVSINNNTREKITYYKTNNPSIFWAKP